MDKEKICGILIIIITFVLIAYYTTWVVILPFAEGNINIHDYFPNQFLALSIPLLIGVVGLISIGVYVCVVLATDWQRKCGHREQTKRKKTL